jgi:hypothetical protein
VSLGLNLRGTTASPGGFLRRRPSAASFLERATRLVSERYAEMLLESSLDRERAAVVLHPAAEPLELTAERPGSIVASANTSSVGPGYHAFVCDLLRELGDALAIEWQPPDDEHFDETEYFETGDAAALEEEMLAWLGSVAHASLEQLDQGAADFALSMPIGDRFATLDVATTPVGPRSRQWLESTDADPRRGIDFFSWWDRGFGASYLLGHALVDMWTRIPWRPPLNEDEEHLMRATLSLLRDAYDAEPERQLPWRAWSELSRLVDPDEELPEGVKAAVERDTSAPTGYRRHDVTAALPAGWSVRIPGSFVTGFDDDATWVAHDGGQRSANVTVFGGISLEAELPASEGVEHRDDEGGVVRRAWTSIQETEEGPFVLLTGFAIAGDTAAHATMTAEPGGEDWALDVWRSLSRRRY